MDKSLFIFSEDVLNVHDERDPTSTNRSTRRDASHAVEIQLKAWGDLKGRNLHGIKIGIPEVYNHLSVHVRSRYSLNMSRNIFPLNYRILY